MSSQLGRFDTLEEVYRNIQLGTPAAVGAWNLLWTRDWFHEFAEFDERTGQAMPKAFSAICADIAKPLGRTKRNYPRDRLYWILEHIHKTLPEIARRLNERMVREQALLPAHAVRELDSASLAALSRRPGRTIRQKMADKPYLMAVKRRSTVDSAENRLLKSLCFRLQDLLRLRSECFHPLKDEDESETLQALEAWLRDPEVECIRRWENLPPNNTLLQHRSYRRIWNAWLWLQTIDNDLQKDQQNRGRHWALILFWMVAARMYAHPRVRIAEQPCYLEYDSFKVEPAESMPGCLASINGLLTAPYGHFTGNVRIKTERNYGFARTHELDQIFFHANDFIDKSVYDSVGEGTSLWFAVQKTANGWKASHIQVAEPTCRFSLSLNQELEIVYAARGGDKRLNVSIGDPVAEQLPVRVENSTISASINPHGAARIAEGILHTFLCERSRDVGKKSAGPIVLRNKTHAVIDLCTIHPRFACDDENEGITPFRLLWQLWRQPGKESVEIEPAFCRAISLTPEALTVSILDLMVPRREQAMSAGVLGQAAKTFSETIAGFLQISALTYIVPDGTDDFSLEAIRTNLNARYSVCEPLPRSIAAIFDWHSSQGFPNNEIQPNDCVVVFDSTGEEICVTPVIACHRSDLADRLPPSHGFYWERCPSLSGGTTWSSVRLAENALVNCGCSFANQIARLWGLQGIVDEMRKLSWLSGTGEWFSAPEIPPSIQNDLEVTNREWEELREKLYSHLHHLPPKARLFILTVGDGFDQLESPLPLARVFGDRELKWLGHCSHSTHGGRVLQKWQMVAGDIPLWRDHLPDLSIRIVRDGSYQLFHLVKDVTVSPRRNASVPIRIEDTFVLPAGQEFYQFPLLQGTNDNELRYEAFLKSAMFPLKQNLTVSLQLNYSFGRDMPYELTFVPIETNGPVFKSIRVEWRPSGEGLRQGALYPVFPEALTWKELQSFPRRNSDGTHNLLEWIGEVFLRIADQYLFFIQDRSLGRVVKEWRNDIRGTPFTFVESHGRQIFCHSHSFIEGADLEEIGIDCTLSFDIAKNEQGHLSTKYTAVGEDLGNSQWEAIIERKGTSLLACMKSIHFPLLTVFAHGRSLSHLDAPNDFRQVVKAGSEICLKIMECTESCHGFSSATHETLSDMYDESLLLLSILHQDAPLQAAKSLLSRLPSTNDSLRNYRAHYRHMGFAIGDAKLPWQQDLLQKVLAILEEGSQFETSIALQILGIAVWRSSTLIDHLMDEKVLSTTIGSLLHSMKDDLESPVRQSKEGGEWYVRPYVALKLELLLGLLRTRTSNNDKISRMLAIRQPVTYEFEHIVDRINRIIIERNATIHSRVCLTLNKPAALSRTPDLLYALMLFLTGDSGARAIQVTGVSEND